MTTFKTCPECKRQIAEEVFERGTAHAPGCKLRRSLLAKANYAATQKRKASAAKGVATRKARQAQQ